MKQKSAELFEVFLWNDNFGTQIPVIDEQHKQLVALLNKLASYLARLSDLLELRSIIAELTAYVDYHFKTEEAIWQEYFQDDLWYRSHLKTHNE
ncbi:bacteriohemerythrin [Methylomarinum vadi]|uniref:bacteriohemerythrin n=1 Tax=Methylomarinum vadi TaxID=438855 RepID=UPI0004DF2873|nr:hemerythrin domain-containing protein [Methylomarinum vadi]